MPLCISQINTHTMHIESITHSYIAMVYMGMQTFFKNGDILENHCYVNFFLQNGCNLKQTR
jgi:hypothetical protein